MSSASPQATSSTTVAFGLFRLDPGRRLLLRDGAPVQLEGRALDILIHLSGQMGELVGKQALIAAVWPGRVVEENNLAVHISALRRLLGHNADGRSLIQTIPGRGYMLVPDASTPAPDPAAASTPPGTLASPASSFIGRIHERADLLALLAENRLVTITAAGGMGKTRLALEVARARLGAYPDGLHCAELALVDDPALAADQVAALFPLGNATGPATTRLAAFLRHRRLLLLLDNCEHVLRPIRELATTLLSQCPGVSILATSREALGVPGERLFRLPPLTVPTRGATLTLTEALAFDSVRLFVERAAASVPGFAFDAAAVPAIVDICAQLDGIALAIEMAVPRLRMLTPAELARRLRESLRLLAAPDRTVVPRHQTLRAVIDWSHALLDDEGRRLLRRLAVFAGAVDIEAVSAIAWPAPAPDSDGEAELDTLETLTDLVEKSLVVADTSVGHTRYRLLETVRQYARDRLASSPEPDEPATLRCRHADHYTAVFEDAAARWPTAHTEAWLPQVTADAEELRAALAWCFGPGGDTTIGLRLVAASIHVWWELPNLPLREARSWFDRAVPLLAPDTPPLVAARIWFGHAWRDMDRADVANLASAERAVSLFAQTPDRQGQGAALWRAGSAAMGPDTVHQATSLLQQAERMLRSGPPGKWLSLCLVRLGDLRIRAGLTDAALAAYEEAMDLAQRTRHWYGLTNGGSNMADLLFHLGRRDEALDRLRTLRISLPLGPRTPLTSKLASHLAAAGLFDEARCALAEVLDHARAIGYGNAFARSLETLALMRVQGGDSTTAALLAGYARATQPPATRWGAPRAVFDRLQAALEAALPAAELARRLAQGASWDEPTADTRARAALAASSDA